MSARSKSASKLPAPSAPGSVMRSIALIYGAAGWTGAQAHIDGPAGSDRDTLSGWTIGAGVDYAFTNNVFGRLEYRYNDYGSADLLGLDGDFDQHVVMIGVGYKF